MSTYERSGKVLVPAWWLAKVLPLLESDEVNYAVIARAASIYAGRKSAWRADAISKFKTGLVRTIELANGISEALHIPHPFFAAPSEQAAVEMHQVMRRAQERALDDVGKLGTYDAMADREIRSTEPKTTPAGVHSADHAKRSGRGARSGRPDRGGS